MSTAVRLASVALALGLAACSSDRAILNIKNAATNQPMPQGTIVRATGTGAFKNAAPLYGTADSGGEVALALRPGDWNIGCFANQVAADTNGAFLAFLLPVPDGKQFQPFQMVQRSPDGTTWLVSVRPAAAK